MSISLLRVLFIFHFYRLITLYIYTRYLPDNLFFFLNDPPPTEIYTLPLHDPLPIWPVRHPERPARGHQEDRRPDGGRLPAHLLVGGGPARPGVHPGPVRPPPRPGRHVLRRDPGRDRKSTRLNSSHQIISYAVFCLKK